MSAGLVQLPTGLSLGCVLFVVNSALDIYYMPLEVCLKSSLCVGK